MQLNLSPKIFITSAALLVIAVGGGIVWFTSKHGGSADERRIADLTLIAQILDTYYRRHGNYPQPTVRQQKSGAVTHVWGYRPGVPAQASCTIAWKEKGAIDALASGCGGDIRDAAGNIIGWKGTITLESALNSVSRLVTSGKPPDTPLSQLTQSLPVDPAFAESPGLTEQGFGEYVYAVRFADSGVKGRGGVQYQLATTVRDEKTGTYRTFLQGNYFASSDQPGLPSSLIGPGLLPSSPASPDSPGDVHHVLAHGQEVGKPNPELGHGRNLYASLLEQRRLERLATSVQQRQGIVQEIPAGRSQAVLEEKLTQMAEDIDHALKALRNREQNGPTPSSSDLVERLVQATEGYVASKAKEAELTLEQHLTRAETVHTLSGFLLKVQGVQDNVLLARDEIVRYLQGDGVLEQSRARAARKIDLAIKSLSDALVHLEKVKVQVAFPFLPSSTQEHLDALRKKERGSVRSGVPPPLPTEIEQPTSRIFLTTFTQEIVTLAEELITLLQGVQSDLHTSGISLDEVDGSLQVILHALDLEMRRIQKLHLHFFPNSEVESMLTLYRETVTKHGTTTALQLLGAFSHLPTNYEGMLFPSSVISTTLLREESGVPDFHLQRSPWEATYMGIPYPLPTMEALLQEAAQRVIAEMGTGSTIEIPNVEGNILKGSDDQGDVEQAGERRQESEEEVSTEKEPSAAEEGREGEEVREDTQDEEEPS